MAARLGNRTDPTTVVLKTLCRAWLQYVGRECAGGSFLSKTDAILFDVNMDGLDYKISKICPDNMKIKKKVEKDFFSFHLKK